MGAYQQQRALRLGRMSPLEHSWCPLTLGLQPHTDFQLLQQWHKLLGALVTIFVPSTLDLT